MKGFRGRRDYGDDFYRERDAESHSSAEVVVPLLLQWISVGSVIDIGCGVGTWLRAFGEHGVADLVGVEGDWVSAEALVVPEADLRSADLREPLELERGFDLALSLEVAEHLPPRRADSFVAELCRLAPVVLFSAAVPLQGGRSHVNEQWPEYWVERFAACGYEVLDLIRPRIWNDERVLVWYRQNLFLFVERDRSAALALADAEARMPLAVVHPQLYLRKHKKSTPLRSWVRRLRKR